MLLRRAMHTLQCRFIQAYGMTETTGTIVALPPEDHIEGLDRMRSAGKALPGIELAIIDACHGMHVTGRRGQEDLVGGGEVGDVEGRSCVLVDDLIDTAGTIGTSA